MSEYDELFIGGVADGQWMRVPDDRSHWLIPTAANHWTGVGEPIITSTAYRRERLRTSYGELVYYVADHLTAHDAIRRLMIHYQPNNEKM